MNRFTLCASIVGLSLLAACGKNPEPAVINVLPSFIRGTPAPVAYDGTSNDLLTAGLGRSGLASAAAPAFVDAASPTANESRALSIYTSYRAMVDTTAAGGYGTLYGPNVDVNGVIGSGEGRIAGEEWIAFSDAGLGAENVTMMVQIPSTFDVNNPCIVAAASPGSLGIYGAIASAGEWGLKRGCAVAYTDKGAGNGFHDLQTDTVVGIGGARLAGATAGVAALFNANLAGLPQADMAAFNTATPNRLAFKHAHSQRNFERDWGVYVLQSVRFALYALNQKYGDSAPNNRRAVKFTALNTLVMGSSVGNGGGAVLAAVEVDAEGLLDGIAVAQPQVQPIANATLKIQRGGVDVASFGKSQMDYLALANLFQPCAATAASLANSPASGMVVSARAQARCQSLTTSATFNIGVSGATNEVRAQAALAKLRAAGWEAESDLLHASHYALATPALAVTNVNAYGRKSVKDHECGYSFASTNATTFLPAATPATTLMRLFGAGSGLPPTLGINLVSNNSVGGATQDAQSIDVDGSQSLNADGAKCIASRVINFGQATAPALPSGGINEVLRSGNLRGKPAIIVHGRADALVPVNHSSRPYFGLNKIVEGATSRLSYIEVTNAQHLDALNGTAATAGYDSRFVPMQRYYNQAMDALYANLKNNVALPASQVVRTTPRGGAAGAAPAITAANVPPMVAAPTPANAITFANNTVSVPE